MAKLATSSKNVRRTVFFGLLTSCLLIVLFGRTMRLTEKAEILSKSLQASASSAWQLPGGFWSGSANRTNADTADKRRDAPGGTLLIPSDQELGKMNDQQMTILYWKYVNTMQTICRNQTRLGSFKDGGKEICVDNEFLPRKPCLVYSFGSNFQFDFEQAVIAAFGCDVHTFDPTMNLKQKGKTVPNNVHFQLKGLAGHDHKMKSGWEMRTLDTIMTELDHQNKIIDILKIDIEGGEWMALRHMFQAGTLKRAKQLSIEIHFGQTSPGRANWGGVNNKDMLMVLRDLYNEGFRIFMREHNLFSLRPFKSEFNTHFTNVNEISLINLKYKNS